MRGLVLVVAAALTACGNCDDEIDAAGKFLNDRTNLACKTTDDCTVVSTGCHTYSGGVCAHTQLNRAAAASAEWSKLQSDLEDCDSHCEICEAGVVPICVAGLCGGLR